MANTFLTPSKIISGSNALNEAGSLIAAAGKKALVVTDAMMVKLGNIAKLEEVLKNNNVEYVIHPEINSEPNDLMILDGVKAYKENNCDFLIALGGGSPIDSAKAIGMMSLTDHEISSFMGKIIDVDMPSLVAIPTTAGTGSEATKFTIINDTKTQVKMLLTGPCLIPSLAIIDPQFTMTAPKSVTVATGIDALCHAVEAYTSKKAQPLSDTFALSAIKRIFNNLLTCANEPNNEEARIQMSLAATEAGVAFNNSSVTIVHGMSRPIGAIFHIAHGLSNAVLLEACMNKVKEPIEDKFAAIARYVGMTSSSCDEEASKVFLDNLHELLINLDVPTMKDIIKDVDLYKASVKKMAHDALASGSPNNTIYPISEEEMVEIYMNLIA